jgi:hypothetical protein
VFPSNAVLAFSSKNIFLFCFFQMLPSLCPLKSYIEPVIGTRNSNPEPLSEPQMIQHHLFYTQIFFLKKINIARCVLGVYMRQENRDKIFDVAKQSGLRDSEK